MNKTKDYTGQIERGNTLRLEALAPSGRIHIEGTGPIVAEVSVDAVHYKQVEHDVEFEQGVAIAPLRCYTGDHLRLSATTLTKVTVNYNDN